MKALFAALSLAMALVASTAHAQSTETYEDYIKRGSEAFHHDDLETALLLFSKAQQLHDHPRVRLSIARIHEQLGECAAAKANYLLLMESDRVEPEIRRQAGEGLANLTRCAKVEVLEATVVPVDAAPELPAVVVAPPAPAPSTGRARRVVGVSMLGGGVTLTAAGLIVATGVFLPRAVRECAPPRATLGQQTAACDALATIEDVEFWEAHSLARRQTAVHRVLATSLLTTGLVASSVGVALLLRPRAERHRAHVTLGPASIQLVLELR